MPSIIVGAQLYGGIIFRFTRTIEGAATGLTHGKDGCQGQFDENQIILKALGGIFLRPILAFFFVRGAIRTPLIPTVVMITA